MSTPARRVITLMLLAGTLALQATPAFAQFTQAGTQATSFVVQLLTPLAGLGVIAVAIGCFTGRVPWGWFIGVVLGIALFFGRDQVISLVRGWFGT